MDPLRKKLIKLAIEKIDRNPDTYNTLDDQNQMLGELIQTHGLKVKEKPKWGRGRFRLETIDLTVDRYREIMAGICGPHCRSQNPQIKKTIQLFTKGSAIIYNAFLESIGLDGASGVDSDIEGESNGEEHNNQGDNVQEGSDDKSRKHENQQQQTSKTSFSIDSDQGDGDETNVADTKRKAEENFDSNNPRKRPKGVGDTPESQARDGTALLTNKVAATRRLANRGSSLEVNRLVKLSNEFIASEMKNIWTQTQSFARKILKSAEIELDEWALPVTRPAPDLEALYSIMFGQKSTTAILHLKQYGAAPDASALIEGCTSAAIRASVWDRHLPWLGPMDTMKSLEVQKEFLDRVLGESDTTVRLETAVWQAAQCQVLDQEFQQNVIGPIATDPAHAFMVTIEPQIRGLGATQNRGTWEQRSLQRAKDLAKIITKALILKGMMVAAPQYYTTEWIGPDTDVVEDAMEEMHAIDDGPRVVKWCVTPLVKVRQTKDGPEKVACPAKVFSRPKEEDQQVTKHSG